MADLSDAYANTIHIPGGAEFPARWAEAAAAFRAAHPPEDIPYGEHPRERLHLFRPEGAPRGLLVFVHGGYWMAFSASDFSHLAAGAVARGWAVALPSYPLCPEVGVGAIARACARAVERAAQEVAGPVHLTGHSAGGHVVARLACADVPLAVRDRLARAVPISPLSNLLPLRHTDLNETLRLSEAEAVAESPMLRPTPQVPVTVWVGESERPAFRDQALWLSRAWDAPLVVDPGRHHFDVIAGLEEPGSLLTRTVLDA
ncbi:Esterase/lipase [Rubellimicrobium mesophilum DSM 19309]|uniref:Esterase/lipase n=1 Tax=Rubellimicrobium mesophilum DSM 19309 TaxID=442562 RepID=A0A017HSL9_9RHOB|nr:alpha/beta hydrolase [Rubellimicrobium mesophilum]EYD77330.1 Esterase/lipase [Rubellimicrobium mesophilum DSM 19309]